MTLAPNPAMSNSTGSAPRRTSRSGRSAICAMLREFGWRADFSAMLLLVTRNAQRQSIVNVKGEIRELGQRFDVVGVNIALLSATLACVAIALKNSFAPFGEITLILAALAMGCYAPLPHRGSIARFPVKQTLARAEPGAPVYGVKLLSAGVACLYEWFSAVAPALFRTPLGTCSILLNLKRLTAHFAGFCCAVASSLRAIGREAFNGAIFLRLNAWVECAPTMYACSVLNRSNVEIMSLGVLTFRIRECLVAATSACIHACIIAQHALSVKYVAVTSRRMIDRHLSP